MPSDSNHSPSHHHPHPTTHVSATPQDHTQPSPPIVNPSLRFQDHSRTIPPFNHAHISSNRSPPPKSRLFPSTCSPSDNFSQVMLHASATLQYPTPLYSQPASTAPQYVLLDTTNHLPSMSNSLSLAPRQMVPHAHNSSTPFSAFNPIQVLDSSRAGCLLLQLLLKESRSLHTQASRSIPTFVLLQTTFQAPQSATLLNHSLQAEARLLPPKNVLSLFTPLTGSAPVDFSEQLQWPEHLLPLHISNCSSNKLQHLNHHLALGSPI